MHPDPQPDENDGLFADVEFPDAYKPGDAFTQSMAPTSNDDDDAAASNTAED